MVICAACQTENNDDAALCRNPKCGMAIPFSLPIKPVVVEQKEELQRNSVAPIPTPIPAELLNQAAVVLQEKNPTGGSTIDLISALINHAAGLTDQAAVHDIASILPQLTEALGRSVLMGESHPELLVELIRKLSSMQVQSVAMPAPIPADLLNRVAALVKQANLAGMSNNEVISTLADHSALNDITAFLPQLAQLGIKFQPDETRPAIIGALISKLMSVPAPPPASQAEIHNHVEELVGRKIQDGEQAKNVFTELLEKLGVVTPDHVKFPTVASKLLAYLPGNFRWLAAVVVPMVIGGGSGYIASPDQKKELAGTNIKLSEIMTQKAGLTAELEKRTLELTKSTDETQKLRSSLDADKTVVVQQLAEAREKINAQNDSLEAAKKNANALRRFASRGFVEWRGGGGDLLFSANGGASSGTKEGTFPESKCEIVEVIGDVQKAQEQKGTDCFHVMKVKGKPSDDKKVLIVWKQKSGN